jgi:pimeloyl-ACP methyl ester carboxylesterase
VLLDFLGFGASDKPDHRYSIRNHADVAARVAREARLERCVLVTHDMGDTVGGELLARDADDALGFDVVRRVLTNGSIYIEMAQLTPGQQFLLDLDDARLEIEAGPDQAAGFKAGLASTFSPAHAATDEELDLQWQLVTRNGGYQLLPRTIRYIEDRRAEQDRYTGAIESHPSPLGVIWGDVDPVAVYPMVARLVEARPDATRRTLEGVGHYPMIEAPERFAAALLDLVDR